MSQMANGRWQGKLTVDGRRKSLYAPTKRELTEKMRDYQAAVAKGEPQPMQAGREKLSTYLERWLETVAEPKLKRSTVVTYKGYIRNHLVPRLGNHQLNKLSPEHVDRTLAEMRKEGLSPRSIQQARAILRSALAFAEKRGLVVRNVARLSEPPAVTKHEVRPLTSTEAQALIAAAQEERLGALWILMLDSGLRRGEALGLRWQDVDLERCSLRVVQARESLGDGYAEPKSKTSRRALTFSSLLAEALQSWKARQDDERQVAKRWEAGDLIFTTPGGKGISPDSASGAFPRFLERHGLRKIRLHDLRHSSASLLLHVDTSLHDVSKRLGHSSVGITGDIYGHLYEEKQRAAGAAMDSILRGREHQGPAQARG